MGFMKTNKLMHPLRIKRHQNHSFLGLCVAILVVLSPFAKTLGVSPWISEVVSLRRDSVPDEAREKIPRPLGRGASSAFSAKSVPYQKAPQAYQLASAKWVPQSFNNCGPAAVSMVLQYFGYSVSQEETKAHLRTNPDDKNVFITEISAYLRNEYDIENKVLFNGDLETIKTLVANGIYVVVEDWLRPGEDIGHVLIIRGYDDSRGVLIADDSYFGVGIAYPYTVWDEEQWKPYQREYMPVYTEEKTELVKSIIGENWNENTMHRNSVLRNLKDVEANSQDMYAWFNLGSAYFGLGEYEKAKDAFEKSKSIGWPHRILWYSTLPVETYIRLGEYENAVNTANLGLWYNDNYAEMHHLKAVAYERLGETDLANFEAKKARELDPKY